MNILLDTCAFIWLCSAPHNLTDKLKLEINNYKNNLLISDASILEISLKHSIGKLKLPESPENWINKQINIWGIECLIISKADIYESAKLPWLHKDPFDRLIIATAKNHSLAIATCDQIFKEYSVEVLW